MTNEQNNSERTQKDFTYLPIEQTQIPKHEEF